MLQVKGRLKGREEGKAECKAEVISDIRISNQGRILPQ